MKVILIGVVVLLALRILMEQSLWASSRKKRPDDAKRCALVVVVTGLVLAVRHWHNERYFDHVDVEKLKRQLQAYKDAIESGATPNDRLFL